MSKEIIIKTKETKNKFFSFLYLIVCTSTAMIGYTMHNSIFWSIIDFLLTPLVWFKWLIFKEVTLDIILKTFSWFF